MKNKTIIARRNKCASADALETLQQAFENGKCTLDGLCEEVSELGGKIYGLSYILTLKNSGLNALDFKTVGDRLSAMDPEQLARIVGMSKNEIGDQVCEEYGIGIDDKDFSGGADVSRSEIQIDLYFMGGAQGTTAKIKK